MFSFLKNHFQKRKLDLIVFFGFLILLSVCFGEKVFAATPLVTTEDPDSNYIFSKTAVVDGTVIDHGGGHITKVGFEYGLAPTPVWDRYIEDDWWPGTTTYSLDLSNLNASTTYYYRFYAVNSEGTGYGNWKSFTTKEAPPWPGYKTSGTLLSKNLLEGKGAHSIDYFAYDASIPATTSIKVQFSQDNSNWYNSSGVLDGWDALSDGDHSSTSSAIDLSTLNWSGPNFYYKALFETSNTSTTPVLKDITLYYTEGIPPIITTEDPDPNYVFSNTAVVDGTINDNGGSHITKVGFEYGLAPNPVWDRHIEGDWWPGTTTYSLDLSNLNASTTYYYRFYAVNSKGTSYGSWKSFTTEASSSWPGYATSGTLLSKNLLEGKTVYRIDYFGYDASIPASTSIKVQFSQDNSNWYNSSGVLDGWDALSDGDHSSTSSAIGLSTLNWSGPNFYYKALFETSNTSTTPVLKNITLYYTEGIPPIITTEDPDPNYVFSNTAVVDGTINDNGGSHITKLGFEYGLAPTPVWNRYIEGDWWPGTTTYSLDLSNLNASTTYFYRFYAVNSKGTNHGNWKSFTTKEAAPWPGYATSGILLSKNLLEGKTVELITSFKYDCEIPTSTSLKIQFSQNNQDWYSVLGEKDAWTDLEDGFHILSFQDLQWSGPYFYYKVLFETSNTSTTPVLKEITLTYNVGFSIKKEDGCSCSSAVECYNGICEEGVCGGPELLPPNTPSELSETWSDCLFKKLSIPTFHWDYSHPGDVPQAGYEIRIYGESVLDVTSTVPSTDYTPSPTWVSNNLLFGEKTYSWEVKNVNENGRESDWSEKKDFQTRKHAYPWSQFDYSPSRPSVNEVVTTTNNSICYDAANNATSCASWLWTVNGTSTPDGTWKFATGTATSKEPGFAFFNHTSYDVGLKATDSDGNFCSPSKSIPIELPLPKWREIAPPF